MTCGFVNASGSYLGTPQIMGHFEPVLVVLLGRGWFQCGVPLDANRDTLDMFFTEPKDLAMSVGLLQLLGLLLARNKVD